RDRNVTGVQTCALPILSIKFFRITFIQGGILGFMIAAVSPAVIVPSMLDLMEEGIGKEKNVPTLILAGASIDDVFAITIFSVFRSEERRVGKECVLCLE